MPVVDILPVLAEDMSSFVYKKKTTLCQDKETGKNVREF
jgi:hypothetical protein